MHFDRDALAFKALVALDEVADQAGERPIEPSYAIRFTLAWLFSISNGERWVYDSFFQTMRDPMAGAHSRDGAAYRRGSGLRSGIQGIAKSIWYREITPEFLSALDRARLPKAEREELEARDRAADAAKRCQIERERSDRRPQGQGLRLSLRGD